MHKLTLYACIVACVTTLSGCAHVIDKTIKKSDLPPVEVIQTAELGTTLLIQENALIMHGRNVTPVTRGYSLENFSSADFFGMYLSANNGKDYCGTIILRDLLNNGLKRNICLTNQGFLDKKLPYVESEKIVAVPTNLKQLLEYAGKSANTITLYYKEFNDEFIRPAFTQEFKFDLSESKIIGIKGARIEVIDANNTGITYKVIKHFPR